jgi:hypothetical protein
MMRREPLSEHKQDRCGPCGVECMTIQVGWASLRFIQLKTATYGSRNRRASSLATCFRREENSLQVMVFSVVF